jgi:RNA polymerase sigma-70 factor (ECF subfamily)
VTGAPAAAERAARDSYGRLLAFLAARGRDIAQAEDALADAFAAALATWPRDGVPDRPEAWLLTAARRWLLDGHRCRATASAAEPTLRHAALLAEETEAGAIPDHRLALLLACAAPEVERAAQAPLMLQVVLGLDAARIASAFLVSPAAMGQRPVRAKRRIAASGARFTLPGREVVAERLPAVLEAIYAAYAAGAQDPADGGALAGEALWLARIAAARDAAGRYVPLSDQDPASWDAACRRRRRRCCGRPSRWAGPAASSGRPRCNPCTPRGASRAARTGRRSSCSTTRCSAPRPAPSWRWTARWRWRRVGGGAGGAPRPRRGWAAFGLPALLGGDGRAGGADRRGGGSGGRAAARRGAGDGPLGARLPAAGHPIIGGWGLSSMVPSAAARQRAAQALAVSNPGPPA